MGKRIAIAGADFSVNGITGQASILQYVITNGDFYAQRGLSSFTNVKTGTVAAGRCALGPIGLAGAGYTLSNFRKVRINFKAGLDYVCGVGDTAATSTNWQACKGDTLGGNFANGWDTTHNYAEFATNASNPLYISLNFKKSNGDDFDAATTLADLVDDILLLP